MAAHDVITLTIMMLVTCLIKSAGSSSRCGAFDAKSLAALPDKVQHITSPNYPRPYPYDVEVCWKVEAAGGYRVILETTDLEVELQQSQPCSEADYVDVRDGYYETSPLLRRLCGVQHINITSTKNHMFIRFVSDMSIAWKGFYMRFWAVPEETATILPDTPRDGCKETSRLTVFNDIMLELVSPNFPYGYHPSLDKCWQLESIDTEKVVYLEVLESQLEQAYSCLSGDYVEARDGTDPTDRLLDRWCGDSFPTSITSSGPYLLLRFHTDLTDSHFSGFRIRYSIIDPPISPATPELYETSTWVLIGAGVLLLLLSLLFAGIAIIKRGRPRPGTSSSRRGSRVSNRRESHTEQLSDEDRIRAAFTAILRRPGQHRDIRISDRVPSNLRTLPPYQPPERPPTHLGFVAPTQPGYHPWMVKKERRRPSRHRSEPLQTNLPTQPPAYEDIVKDLQEQEWIMGPVLDEETIATVSEAVQSKEGIEIPTPPPHTEVYDYPPSEVSVNSNTTPLPGLPPGCVGDDPCELPNTPRPPSRTPRPPTLLKNPIADNSEKSTDLGRPNPS